MMKKLVSLFAISIITLPAMAAPSGRGRPAMATNMVMSAPRATASINQINTISGTTVDKSSVQVESVNAQLPATSNSQPEVEEPVKDMREAEKAACLNNNIGIGNTFVWASRLSNTASYHSMIEDIENPQNNTCFVRVEMRSNDSRISVDDIQAKYFEMGSPVECGSWVDEGKMRQRILDGKKTARVWATVGATVGGAGLGVGIMELFGNKLIGGKVEGQKAMEGDELLRSQLLTLKDKNRAQYNEFVGKIEELIASCEDTTLWANTAKPAACEKVPNYKLIISTANSTK